jgi:hypothetical protein
VRRWGRFSPLVYFFTSDEDLRGESRLSGGGLFADAGKAVPFKAQPKTTS